MSDLHDCWDKTKDPDPYVRDLAIYDLYVRAEMAEKNLAAYRESDARRRTRAEVAVVELGRLIRDLPPGRKTVPLDAVRDIWRTACHG